MNTQYYNPAIRYLPGVDGKGDSKGSQTNPLSVLTDPYNKQKTDQLLQSKTSINLTTEYPDRVWCTKNNPTAAELANTNICRKNSDYQYPNATFKYGRTSGGPNQQVTATMLSQAMLVTGAPYYYSVVPSEFCTTPELKTCVTASAPIATHPFAAKSRWCSDSALTNCQAIKNTTFKYPRYVGASVAAAAASGTIEVTKSQSRNITSIKVNGKEILGATVTWGNTDNDAGLAELVKNQINAYASNPKFTATRSGAVLTITSTPAAGATANGSVTVTGSATTSYTSVTGGVTAVNDAAPYSFVRTDIVPGGSFPRAGTRTDCAASTHCTYDEEITNFGNWYAYYRTRMQSMKTAASLAFKEIDNRFRVGLITIANQSSTGNYLPIDTFVSGTNLQKEKWYTTLFNISPTTSTPLRSALSIVGRIYAGQKPVGNSDPVQYSCQQNFALLTTDGYWNTDADTDVKGLNGSPVGNLDSAQVRPQYEGPTASSNSLADVAKYYNEIDLRTPALNNCTNGIYTDLCTNNVFVSNTDSNVKQHMTTFTLGLGIDGTLAYTNDYKTASTGDYAKILNGSANWPVPAADTATAVDDLWHAAVNGGGTYFSAKDPSQLTKGLNDALSSIGAKLGSGAAAATSTLNPVAGDNFAFVATYTTVKWQGNLEARDIDLNTGVVNQNASWCVENVVAGSCIAPSSVISETTASGTSYFCATPGASSATCNGPGQILDGSVCKVNMPVACTGTMASKVGATTDTRRIYMRDVKGGTPNLVDFNYTNLSSAQQGYFAGNSLSQSPLLNATQKAAAAGQNLVNFLRGQNGFEDRTSNPPENRLFRYREAVMGDALESQPAYVGKPQFAYTDSGYSAFVTSKKDRAKTVFIGTNDGMLHAFNGDLKANGGGNERWAYVPSMVIPNMWKLADKNYATMHTNYVNGRAVIGDICPKAPSGTCDASEWRTILVGGLNGGGRGYYALDVTDPASPSLLWEIDSITENNLGYSFGTPVITKKPDGTWVVLLTSGYNNVNPGNGQGYLFVRNAWTGTHISRISTGVGSTTTPSGLGKVAGRAVDPMKNNTSRYVYGGDLEGNLWRFDLSTNSSMAFAVLKDPNGIGQPITSTPEISTINKKDLVMVATGKYLEISDLTNTQKHSVYAIKDDNATTTLNNPRTVLQEQVITTDNAVRNATSNAVDFENGRGWYVDLPDVGERNHVDLMLDSGILFVPTTVPSNTVCSPGGYGWFNYFNYATGTNPNKIVSQKFNAPIVGINVYYLKGQRKIGVVTSDDGTPKEPSGKVPSDNGGSRNFVGKRLIWREYIPQAQ
jgi:type IV pilus assembly protein PilY1